MFIRLQNQHNNLGQIKEYKAYRNILNRLLRLAKKTIITAFSTRIKVISKKREKS